MAAMTLFDFWVSVEFLVEEKSEIDLGECYVFTHHLFLFLGKWEDYISQAPLPLD